MVGLNSLVWWLMVYYLDKSKYHCQKKLESAASKQCYQATLDSSLMSDNCHITAQHLLDCSKTALTACNCFTDTKFWWPNDSSKTRQKWWSYQVVCLKSWEFINKATCLGSRTKRAMQQAQRITLFCRKLKYTTYYYWYPRIWKANYGSVSSRTKRATEQAHKMTFFRTKLKRTGK